MLLLFGMIGGAVPASAAEQEERPLEPRRVFDQSRPAVELVTAEFTAQLSVPEPRITLSKQREMRALVLAKIERGEVSATEVAARDAVVEELARDPFRWFSRSDRVHRGKLKLSAVGSGFSVSANGYIVTNAHVVAPRDEDLKATFLRDGLHDQIDDSIHDLISGGITQSLATKYANARVRWLTKMSKLSRVERKLEAVSPSGTGGVVYSGGRPAKLVAASKELPGKDVAVIKVDAKNMATVQLGNETALSTGDRLFVLGFPGPATFNPALSKDSQKEPTLTQGVLSAKKTLSKGSTTVLQTDAGMTHGNSGGPVFDEQGKVIGVATFGSVDPLTGREVAGLNFAVPVSVVSELLGQAKVRPVEGAATAKYRLALDAYDRHWYKRALPLLSEVKALDPSHPTVERLLKDSRAAIAQGRDRTPREILGLPLLLAAAVAAITGLLLVVVLVLALRRRRRAMRRRQGVAGAPPFPPEPAFQAVRQPGLPVQPEPTGWGTPAAAERSDWWPGQPSAAASQSRWPAEQRTVELPAPVNGEQAAYPAAADGQSPAQHEWWHGGQHASALGSTAYPAEPAEPAAPARHRQRLEPAPAEPAAESLRCGSCGRQNPVTNRFCEECWNYLEH